MIFSPHQMMPRTAERRSRLGRNKKMRRPLTVLASAALIVALTPATSISARADNGRIAAGVVGGLAVGTLLGAAATAPRTYYAPAPVYVEPAPLYEAPS